MANWNTLASLVYSVSLHFGKLVHIVGWQATDGLNTIKNVLEIMNSKRTFKIRIRSR